MRVLMKTDIGDRRTARAPSSTDYSLINRGQRGEQTPNPAASNSMHGTPGRIRIAFRRRRTGLSTEIPYLRLEHPMCAILQRATHPFGSEGSSPEPLKSPHRDPAARCRPSTSGPLVPRIPASGTQPGAPSIKDSIGGAWKTDNVYEHGVGRRRVVHQACTFPINTAPVTPHRSPTRRPPSPPARPRATP